MKLPNWEDLTKLDVVLDKLRNRVVQTTLPRTPAERVIPAVTSLEVTVTAGDFNPRFTTYTHGEESPLFIQRLYASVYVISASAEGAGSIPAGAKQRMQLSRNGFVLQYRTYSSVRYFDFDWNYQHLSRESFYSRTPVSSRVLGSEFKPSGLEFRYPLVLGTGESVQFVCYPRQMKSVASTDTFVVSFDFVGYRGA